MEKKIIGIPVDISLSDEEQITVGSGTWSTEMSFTSNINSFCAYHRNIKCCLLN